MYKATCSNCGKNYERKTKPNKLNFCSVSCQNKFQYNNGIRDRFQITKAANKSLREKGQYTRDNSYLKGENNHAWIGGRNITKNGYIRLRVNNAYVLEHRYIWEQHNGKIPEGYQIHHINHNKQDNRIENLECKTNEQHQRERKFIKDNKGRFIKEIYTED